MSSKTLVASLLSGSNYTSFLCFPVWLRKAPDQRKLQQLLHKEENHNAFPHETSDSTATIAVGVSPGQARCLVHAWRYYASITLNLSRYYVLVVVILPTFSAIQQIGSTKVPLELFIVIKL